MMDIEFEDNNNNQYQNQNNQQMQPQTSSTASTNRHQFTVDELLSMIGMIKKFELIWDRNHPQYSISMARSIAFEQIAQELSIPVEDIRWKWQILRKEYFKKVSLSNRSTISGQKPRPWKWSSQLSFLNTVIANNNQQKTIKLKSDNQQQQSLSLISRQIINKNSTNHHHHKSSNGSMSLLASPNHRTISNKSNTRGQTSIKLGEHIQPTLNSEEDSSEQTDNSNELQSNFDQSQWEDDDGINDLQKQPENNNLIDDGGNDDDEGYEYVTESAIVDDEDLPKFFCETIYSPPAPEEDDMNDDDNNSEHENQMIDLKILTKSAKISPVKKQQQKPITSKNSILYFNNNNNNSHDNNFNSNKMIIENGKHSLNEYDEVENESNNDDDNSSNNHNNNHKKFKYNDLNNSQQQLSTIISLLEKQNEILMSTAINIDNRHQSQPENDPFYLYLRGKLSLLQDVPRTAKWTRQFQSSIDQAFDSVYKKFLIDQ